MRLCITVTTNYTARKGIGEGSMTMHPQGIAHGPHPGHC